MTAANGDQTTRARIRRDALFIALSAAPFGVAFGIAAADAGLSVIEAMGFSVLVFAGSAQFAAVSVLGDGGTAVAAITAGLLLNLRSLAFGVAMAPALRGSLPFRLGASQLMIDESTAVGTAQETMALRRYGYLAAGLAVFVLWNASTVLGVAVLSSSGDVVETLGLDAAIPAVFLALLWPRLADPTQRLLAVAGAVVALVLTPITPAGVPIVASAAVVLLLWRRPA
ncbi:MAG: AzlC family ABC transporter permease [Acidimicrobiales bacterium]